MGSIDVAFNEPTMTMFEIACVVLSCLVVASLLFILGTFRQPTGPVASSIDEDVEPEVETTSNDDDDDPSSSSDEHVKPPALESRTTTTTNDYDKDDDSPYYCILCPGGKELQDMIALDGCFHQACQSCIAGWIRGWAELRGGPPSFPNRLPTCPFCLEGFPLGLSRNNANGLLRRLDRSPARARRRGRLTRRHPRRHVGARVQRLQEELVKEAEAHISRRQQRQREVVERVVLLHRHQVGEEGRRILLQAFFEKAEEHIVRLRPKHEALAQAKAKARERLFKEDLLRKARERRELELARHRLGLFLFLLGVLIDTLVLLPATARDLAVHMVHGQVDHSIEEVFGRFVQFVVWLGAINVAGILLIAGLYLLCGLCALLLLLSFSY